MTAAPSPEPRRRPPGHGVAPWRWAVPRPVVWLLVGLALLAAAGPLAGVAGAHATLVSSSPGNDEIVPAAPTEVSLTFDQPVVIDEDSITVVDPDAKRVDAGDARSSGDGKVVTAPLDEGPVGTYTVSYRVLSDDGHVINGSYVYHVKQRTGAAEVSTESGDAAVRLFGALGRWVALAGALLVGGVLAMAVFVDRGRRDDEAGEPTDQAGEPAADADAERPSGPDRGWTGGLAASRRLLLPGAVAALLGTGLALFASAAELAGRGLLDGTGRIPDFVTSGRPGAVAGLRVVVALVLLLAVVGGPLLRRVPWLAGLCVLATLALPSFGGHAGTASPAALAVASDVLHVLGAAAWVGGLAVLALTWTGSRGRALSFSRLAVVAAPLVIATGLLSAWLQERSFEAVTGTEHGRLVLAKLFGALVMLAFGAVHRRWLADTARSIAAVGRGVRVEALIGLGVVALTAVLVATPPGREATIGEPVELVRQAGDTTVRMEVSPAGSGPNDVHLYYLGRDGSLASVDAAELEISTGSIEPRKVPITPITANHGVATGVQLTPGTWTFELTVVAKGVPATTTFEVPIT